MAQGFEVTTNTGFGNITTGTGGAGWNTVGSPNISGTTDRSTTSSRAAGAAYIIDSVGVALAGLGNAVGSIITAVGTSKALQSGTYYSPYNQGQYNYSSSINIGVIAIAVVGIVLITKK